MFKKVLMLFGLMLLTTVSMADVRIGTWNTERLGSGSDKNYQALATVASNFDFLAVQEVMNEEGINNFKKALEAKTGEPWELLSSHLVGRSSYKEMYSFLWRKSKVGYVDGAVVYLDREGAFDRDPFSARFTDKSNGKSFVAATVHVHYGHSDDDRTPEIRSLKDYWVWLSQIYPETKDVMLMGDFNMNPNDDSWTALKQLATPLITEGASTLGLADGRYSSLFDNVWVGNADTESFSKANVVKYPAMLGMTNAEARKTVSDHAPLFLNFGGGVNHDNAASTPIAPAKTIALASSGTGPEIHGNKNSMIYHLPTCPNYAVNPKNLVTFHSAGEAESAGYRMAKNCN